MNNLFFWLSRKINFPLVAPEVIQISLTYRCNLKCSMCSIAGLLPESEELSTAQVFKIIDEAKRFGVGEVLLTGGEPFLRHDIFEISDYIARNKLRSIITTNASVIDGIIASRIGDSKIGHIHISLDGMENVNDYFRSKGSFKKITEVIELLNQKRKQGSHFSLGIACTVMDSNIKELTEIVKLADKLNVDVINFQPLANNNANFLDKSMSAFWVKREHILLLKEEIVKIREYKPKHLTIYEEPRLELLLDYYQGELTKKDWVCFGGFKTVFICFSKNEPLVYSCHGICGNLDKISLKKAWMSKEAYKLRIHSKDCRNLCMQSCYSKESSQNLSNLINTYLKKKR